MIIIWAGCLSVQTSANHTLAAETEAAETEAAETELITLTDLQLGSEWIQHRVAVPECELSCFQRPGEGPTLLLIPGTFSDSRIYALTVRQLDPKLNLIILENRGLGGSWPPPEKSSIESCAEDAFAVMDALKVFRVERDSQVIRESWKVIWECSTTLRGRTRFLMAS